MGFVLKRTRADGKWDAHIVFRGSRSGNATRALIGATDGPFSGPAGNADWVTDMASELKQDDTIGGAVAVGFAASLKRCLGPLHHALQHLHKKYGAPQSVQVTGHSLGAALANICTAALTSGSADVQLAKRLPDWPAASLRGYFMALPPVGTEAFCDAFKQRMGDRASAPYVADDPVVECSKSVSLTKTAFMGWLGARMGSGGYTAGKLDRMPRPDGTVSGENSHEIYLIRTALVKKLADAKTQIPQTVSAATPWATYITFADMLDGKAASHFVGDAPKIVTRENLRRVLVNYHFADHFASFLDMLKSIVADPKAYRGVHGDKQYQLAAERVALALDMAGKIDSKDPAGIADNVATQVAALLAFHVKKEFVQKGWKVVRRGQRPRRRRRPAGGRTARRIVQHAYRARHDPPGATGENKHEHRRLRKVPGARAVPERPAPRRERLASGKSGQIHQGQSRRDVEQVRAQSSRSASDGLLRVAERAGPRLAATRDDQQQQRRADDGRDVEGSDVVEKRLQQRRRRPASAPGSTARRPPPSSGRRRAPCATESARLAPSATRMLSSLRRCRTM